MGDWKARRDALAAADDDEWDSLSEAYDEAWLAAYRAEFVSAAVSRPGWTEELAQEWLDAGDLPREALIDEGWRGTAPSEVAARDVIECEIEAANA